MLHATCFLEFAFCNVALICKNSICPGVAGASGAVAGSTVALWLRHVITRTTTRHPGHDGWAGPYPIDADFRRLPPDFAPSLQFLIKRRSPPAGCFPTHPYLSVALRRLRACGPGRPPSQGPTRVVPNEATAPWSRTSPAPRLRQPRGSNEGTRKRRMEVGIGK